MRYIIFQIALNDSHYVNEGGKDSCQTNVQIVNVYFTYPTFRLYFSKNLIQKSKDFYKIKKKKHFKLKFLFFFFLTYFKIILINFFYGLKLFFFFFFLRTLILSSEKIILKPYNL